MPDFDCLNAFYFALEEEPGDAPTLLALADWHDEEGNDDSAACLRWVVQKRRFPFQYRRGMLSRPTDAFQDGWYWWAVHDPGYGADWGHSQQCRLPRELWRWLRHTFGHEPLVCKEYASVRSAYEALLDAWPLAQPLERQPRRRERPG
jgi:hypothetical protein